MLTRSIPLERPDTREREIRAYQQRDGSWSAVRDGFDGEGARGVGGTRWAAISDLITQEAMA